MRCGSVWGCNAGLQTGCRADVYVRTSAFLRYADSMSSGIVPAPRPLRIVLAGGSGQLGTLLARHFQERGNRVTVLTRSPYAAPWPTVYWDGTSPGEWVETLDGADVCIHLSGRGINCRYTAQNCGELYDSRIGPTLLLHKVFAALPSPPRLWINASSATIYRHSLDRGMDEFTGQHGGGEWIETGIRAHRRVPEKWRWTVSLIEDWEAAFFAKQMAGTRRIALRSSIVMSPAAGAFATLSNLVLASLGGAAGNGRQFVSWIHETDLSRAVEFLIARETISGPVNMTAPTPLPNHEFMAALREAWDMPNGLPIPAPLLSLAAVFLRTEPELLLKSNRVVPGKLLSAGFEFQFPEWPEAAADLVRQCRRNSNY